MCYQEQDNYIPSHHSFLNVTWKVLDNALKRGNWRYTHWEGINTTIFVDNVIVYVDNLKFQQKTFLELIGNYTKISGYKIGTHNSTYQRWSSQLESKNTISFTLVAPKK